MANVTKPIAITMGDAAGIGPEIIVKAFRDSPEQMKDCVVIGDARVMQRALDLVNGFEPKRGQTLSLRSIPNLHESIHSPNLNTVTFFQLPDSSASDVALPDFGQISAVAGRSAADAVLWAAKAALSGDVSAVVTAPLHKEALFAAGVPFPGHTEMLQACAAAHLGLAIEDLPVRMMLANPELRTVLVSIHVSLRQAIDSVTIENLLQTLRVTHKAELAVHGRAPHMAVAGLNPHAGEGGLMGREELEIIIPALQKAKAEGLKVSGPFAPDTVFMRARKKPSDKHGEFDVVIAMYHDQGLIPVKYLGVEQGVNVTLGLPFVRTSPDHGTAFDLAGTGRANPASLVAAVEMAKSMIQIN